MNKKIKKKLIKIFAPFLINIISRLIYLTCKNEFFISKDDRGGNFIAALWHGNFLMMPFLYKKINKNNKEMYLITSGHGDGDLVENYFSYFNFKAIRGSTNKGGMKVIVQAIRELKKGFNVGITPDGPKGPYKSIKDGIIMLAMKSEIPIRPCIIISSRAWTLNTWDKFSIPKPFSTIKYYIKAPLYLDKNMDFEQAKQILKEYMEL